MKYFFLFFTVIRFLHFRQIISNGENMHEMLINSTKNKKKNMVSLSSAELTKSVVEFNP